MHNVSLLCPRRIFVMFLFLCQSYKIFLKGRERCVIEYYFMETYRKFFCFYYSKYIFFNFFSRTVKCSVSDLYLLSKSTTVYCLIFPSLIFICPKFEYIYRRSRTHLFKVRRESLGEAKFSQI